MYSSELKHDILYSTPHARKYLYRQILVEAFWEHKHVQIYGWYWERHSSIREDVSVQGQVPQQNRTDGLILNMLIFVTT